MGTGRRAGLPECAMRGVFKRGKYGPIRHRCIIGGGMARIYRLILVLFLLGGWVGGVHASIPVQPAYCSSVAPYIPHCDSAEGSFLSPSALCEEVLSEFISHNAVACSTYGCSISGTPSVAGGCVIRIGHPTPSLYSYSISQFGSMCPDNAHKSADPTQCECNTGFKEVAAGGSCEAVPEGPPPDTVDCADAYAVSGLPGGLFVTEQVFSGDMASGTYCQNFGTDEAPLNCSVEFRRTARFTNPDGSYSTEGSMSAPSGSASGGCSPGVDAPAPAANSPCPDGYSGEVNGQTVCIPRAPGSPTTTTTEGTTTTNDGTNTTTTTTSSETTCVNGVCTTTTTTTTTVTDNSTGEITTGSTTGTTTQDQGEYCAENPEEPVCEGGTFGGTCGAGFTCEGDAVQCAMAKEQHVRNCTLFAGKSKESDLYEASVDKTGSQYKEGDPVNISSSSFDSSDAIGGGSSCLSDRSITVMGQTITISFSKVCEVLGQLGYVLLGVSYLLAGRILLRG